MGCDDRGRPASDQHAAKIPLGSIQNIKANCGKYSVELSADSGCGFEIVDEKGNVISKPKPT
jgi:hypothetical protein